MNLHLTFPPKRNMTIEKFLAFYDAQPDGEKWELIEGEPVLSPTPTDFHQIVVGNIVHFLGAHKRKTGASWFAMPGISTRVPVSPRGLPQPDIFVLEGTPSGAAVTSDALLMFEILSRNNTKADQAWRRQVYASVPNCQHYVTVSMKSVDVVSYDRAADWKARKATKLDGSLDLAALGVSMPLSEIYLWTPLGAK